MTGFRVYLFLFVLSPDISLFSLPRSLNSLLPNPCLSLIIYVCLSWFLSFFPPLTSLFNSCYSCLAGHWLHMRVCWCYDSPSGICRGRLTPIAPGSILEGNIVATLSYIVGDRFFASVYYKQNISTLELTGVDGAHSD